MITEDYVSFEVAKLLKEKGFDEACLYYYRTETTLGKEYTNLAFIDEYLHNSEIKYGTYEECVCTAPTLQMAMKWLRETYKLHIEVEVLKPYVLDDTKKRTVPSDRVEFHASIIFTDQWNDALEEFKNTGVGWYSTYEEAVEAALKYCLTKLI